MDEVKQEVLNLLSLMPVAPEDRLPAGANLHQISRLHENIGISLPSQLVEWLLICNGPNIARGGVYGIRPDRKFLDIQTHLELHPGWIQKRWLPVAGDGCGNYYLMVLEPTDTEQCPIYFVDHEISYDEINDEAGEIAPDLWGFLYWLFRYELDRKRKTH